MNLELGLIAASLLIVFSAAACTLVLSRVLFSATVDWIGRLTPATRSNLLLAWAASPLLSGLLILAFTLAPSITHLLGFGADHCHAHGHHAHLCLVHTATLTGSTLERLLLGGVSAAVLAWAFAIGFRLRPGQRALRMILALGKPSTGDPHYYIVQSVRPFAVTAGLLHPKVLISSRLLDELKPCELTTVLSHERAHQRRRDGLRLLAADALCRLHLNSTRRFILEHLRLAVEQACDEVAARRSGDRLRVAETILKLSRLASAHAPAPFSASPSITGADTTLRVQGLLRPPLPPRPWLGAGACVFTALLIAAGLITSDWWHHSAESLFGSFLG